jgi:hypothetical protein
MESDSSFDYRKRSTVQKSGGQLLRQCRDDRFENEMSALRFIFALAKHPIFRNLLLPMPESVNSAFVLKRDEGYYCVFSSAFIKVIAILLENRQLIPFDGGPFIRSKIVKCFRNTCLIWKVLEWMVVILFSGHGRHRQKCYTFVLVFPVMPNGIIPGKKEIQ